MPELENSRWLGERLSVPNSTAALLFDMDGVLIDSLDFDYRVVPALLKKHVSADASVDKSVIRANFAYDPPEFWRRLVATTGVAIDTSGEDFSLAAIVADYVEQRNHSFPAVHEGVVEILTAARDSKLKIAVVSNNAETDVRELLENVALLQHVDLVVGNDEPGMKKKPAPDPYLIASRRLGLAPADCVVIEDSLLGAESGSRAGCYTVGVATGTNTLEELQASEFVQDSYATFATQSERGNTTVVQAPSAIHARPADPERGNTTVAQAPSAIHAPNGMDVE